MGDSNDLFSIDGSGGLVLNRQLDAESETNDGCIPLLVGDGTYQESNALVFYIDVNEYEPKPDGIDPTQTLNIDENVSYFIKQKMCTRILKMEDIIICNASRLVAVYNFERNLNWAKYL